MKRISVETIKQRLSRKVDGLKIHNYIEKNVFNKEGFKRLKKRQLRNWQLWQKWMGGLNEEEYQEGLDDLRDFISDYEGETEDHMVYDKMLIENFLKFLKED